jgi:hypothetical protein
MKQLLLILFISAIRGCSHPSEPIPTPTHMDRFIGKPYLIHQFDQKIYVGYLDPYDLNREIRLYGDTTFEEYVFRDIFCSFQEQVSGISPLSDKEEEATVFSGQVKINGDTLLLNVDQARIFDREKLADSYREVWYKKTNAHPKSVFEVKRQRKFTLRCNDLFEHHRRDKTSELCSETCSQYTWQPPNGFNPCPDIFSVRNSTPCMRIQVSKDAVKHSPVKYKSDENNSILIITTRYTGNGADENFNRIFYSNSQGQTWQDILGSLQILDLGRRGTRDTFDVQIMSPDKKLISHRKIAFMR